MISVVINFSIYLFPPEPKLGLYKSLGYVSQL